MCVTWSSQSVNTHVIMTIIHKLYVDVDLSTCWMQMKELVMVSWLPTAGGKIVMSLSFATSNSLSFFI